MTVATSDPRTNQRIDGRRLWDSLMEMAQIGATTKGGVRRLALGPVDKQGRDRFRTLCEQAGLIVRIDAMGNMFARRAGRDPARLPVLFGSHLDSQPSGGKFDGALGVMAGLEVMRSLNDLGIQSPTRPVELVNWTDEEGSRFGKSLMGSRRLGRRLRPGGNGGAGGSRRRTRSARRWTPSAIAAPNIRRGPSRPTPISSCTSSRAPSSRREGKQHRRRDRRPGAGVVRRGRHRPGQPRRHHARPARGKRRPGLCGAGHRPGGPHDARPRRGWARHRGPACRRCRTAATWCLARCASASSSAIPTRPRSAASPRNSRVRPRFIARDCGVELAS